MHRRNMLWSAVTAFGAVFAAFHSDFESVGRMARMIDRVDPWDASVMIAESDRPRWQLERLDPWSGNAVVVGPGLKQTLDLANPY